VVEGLKGKGGLADRGQISTEDLANYVIKRVEELAKLQKEEQEPQYFRGRERKTMCWLGGDQLLHRGEAITKPRPPTAKRTPRPPPVVGGVSRERSARRPRRRGRGGVHGPRRACPPHS
jgi:hypothetical protein